MVTPAAAPARAMYAGDALLEVRLRRPEGERGGAGGDDENDENRAHEPHAPSYPARVPGLCSGRAAEQAGAGRPRGRGPRGHGHEPGQGLLPRGRHHQARRRPVLPRRGRGRAARRGRAAQRARPLRERHPRRVLLPEARARTRGRTGSRSWRCSFPSGRTAEEVVPRDAAALAWMANLGCLELHPHPVRAEDLDHPDELRVDLDPVPGVEWPQLQATAARRARGAGRARPRGLAQDVGLARHPRERAHPPRAGRSTRCGAPRWPWPARSSGARPTLATSKWWKEERHGVFLDYNQNAKDRTVCSAYSVRPQAGRARLGARDLGRAGGVPAGGLHAAHDARALRRHRRPARGHRRASLLAGAAARAVGAAGGRGPGRRALAAALREAGGRAAARAAVQGGRRGAAPKAGGGRRVSTQAADRDRARAAEGRRAGRARALEGAPPRGRRAPAAGRRARRLDARALVDLDARAHQPRARAGGAAAGRRSRSTRTTCRAGPARPASSAHSSTAAFSLPSTSSHHSDIRSRKRRARTSWPGSTSQTALAPPAAAAHEPGPGQDVQVLAHGLARHVRSGGEPDDRHRARRAETRDQAKARRVAQGGEDRRGNVDRVGGAVTERG